MIHGKVSGSFPVPDEERALQVVSDPNTLINCIPGATRINEKEFRVQAKVAMIVVTLTGVLTNFKVEGRQVLSEITVRGPGISATVFSSLKVHDGSLVYDVEYRGDVSQVLEKIARREVERVSNEIIECTRRKATS